MPLEVFQRSEGRWFVQSESTPEALYLVKRTMMPIAPRPAEGLLAGGAEQWTCNCMDNIMRGRECKHIKAVRGRKA